MKARPGAVLLGPAGTATEVRVEMEPRDRPDMAATVATWFLDCPGQSPAWSHYGLSIIHLRPIPGVRPAVVRLPKATHEVLLVALDPAARPTPTSPESWRHLRPLNLQEQVELPHDEAAKVLAARLARAVVDGWLWAEPPLSGQVEPWRSALIRTSAHFRGEAHACCDHESEDS